MEKKKVTKQAKKKVAKAKKKKTTIDDIAKVINSWVEDNDGNVCFYADLVEFDLEKMKANAKDVTSDTRVMCFGFKDVLKIGLEEFTKMFKKDKNEFINW